MIRGGGGVRREGLLGMGRGGGRTRTERSIATREEGKWEFWGRAILVRSLKRKKGSKGKQMLHTFLKAYPEPMTARVVPMTIDTGWMGMIV